MLGYFNAPECPSGWLAADGTNETPDLRGVFVRSFGSQTVNHGTYGSTTHVSGNLGQVQGDAIRNITGEIQGGIMANSLGTRASGAFVRGSDSGSFEAGSSWRKYFADFSASRVVPTGPENRPLNVAMLACIKS